MIYRTYNKKVNKEIENQKEEMDNPYEKTQDQTYPVLLDEYYIEFSHDFTNSP
jgi:hypothetical protein